MRAVGRVVAALLMLVGVLALGAGSIGSLPSADAATVVGKASCRRYDPNLVNGTCLRYRSRTGTSYTWIGSYRASNGHVFFCIDYLYDSRIAGKPEIVASTYLVNQLAQRIGNAEVAALNYIVSTWAAHGSTGSDPRDAAIALIIRELMSDGIRPDHTVVYPRGLKVGQPVKAPVGGLGGPVMALAQSMWSEASKFYGPYTLHLGRTASGPIRLGTTRPYAIYVLSAAGRAVPGVRVTFRCTGPVRCPAAVTTRTRSVGARITPTATGAMTMTASASGPAADGHVYRVQSWHYHGGSTARDFGVQRGWIAERSAMTAQVRDTAVIVKGTPKVVTRASHQTAAPGAALHDFVTVSQLPAGYRQTVTANLYGPFATQPDASSCTPDRRAGSVTFAVDRAGEYPTSTVRVAEPGYYVWTESLPGDVRTNAVSTPCGVAEETTLVAKPVVHQPDRHQPALGTRASARRALVGARLYDTVEVHGLAAGDAITVRWTLRGPLAPRHGSCQSLDWTRAGVLARGSFVARADGSYRTAATVLTQPGCITYAEDAAATSTTSAVHSAPGLPTETALVTRPAIRIVPEIPSGPYVAGHPVRSGR